MLFAYAKINSYYNKHFNFTCWLSTVAALHFHFQILYKQSPTVLLSFVCKPLKSKLKMQRQVSEVKSVKTAEFRNSQKVMDEQ